MPRRFSCVCGYRWCAARDVCSWAWTRVDATEGAYHVKAGTTGTDQHEEYRQFRRAREVRELRSDRGDFVELGICQTGYHRPRLSERTVRSFTPPTVPQWQIDVFRQWLENSDDILDVEDPS